MSRIDLKKIKPLTLEEQIRQTHVRAKILSTVPPDVPEEIKLDAPVAFFGQKFKKWSRAYLLAEKALQFRLQRPRHFWSKFRFLRFIPSLPSPSAKPIHYSVTGVIILSIIIPTLTVLIDLQKYALAKDASTVVASVSPNISAKLTHDPAKKMYQFNKDAADKGPDQLTAMMGGGGKKSEQKFAIDLYESAAAGVVINDVVNQVSIAMVPQFAADDAKLKHGRIVYPLKGMAGQMLYTPKANGLKEDILLTRSPGDDASFSYELRLPEYLEARLTPEGAVGIYSATPELFGRISYSSEADREKVALARKSSPKDYLMFAIPAPEIVQFGNKPSRGVKANFTLSQNILTVHAHGLDKASYPLSIDPTLLISSTGDFAQGNGDENIDFSVSGQISRAPITGGAISGAGWAATGSGLGALYATSVVGYNNYLYTVGTNGTDEVVYHAPVNGDGTLGTWVQDAAATDTGNGKVGTGVVAYNGYLYLIGGKVISSGLNSTEVKYAKIDTASGSVGAWNTTSALGGVGALAYMGIAAYKGYIYVMGGGTGTSETASTQVIYTKTQGDGTLSSWTTNTNSLPAARAGLSATSFSGGIYAAGGRDGTATAGTLQNNVYFTTQKSDGSLNVFVALPATFGTARRNATLFASNNYLYIGGGCSAFNGSGTCTTLRNDVQYATIHADGTLGAWNPTASFTTARDMIGMGAYQGELYIVGGCTAETGAENCSTGTTSVQYANVSGVGNVASAGSPGTAFTTGRYGNAATVYNGYLYIIGGCAASDCYSVQANILGDVQYARLNDDGTVGTWATTTAMPSNSRYGGGRAGFGLVGYNGRLYAIAGSRLRNGTQAQEWVDDIVVGTLNTNGTVANWTESASSLPRKSWFHTAEVFNGYLYVVGGSNETTGSVSWSNAVNYLKINNDGTLPTTWSSANTFTTGRNSHGSAVYNGYLYIVGGFDGTNHKNDIQYAKLNNDGTLGTWSTSGNTFSTARRFLGLAAYNGFLYLYGGRNATTFYSDIQYASVDGSNGSVSTWTTSSSTMSLARTAWPGTAFRGFMYILGGCSSGTSPCSTFNNTTEFAQINNGGRGTTNSWANLSSGFTTGRAGHMSVAYNGRVYVVGGCTAYTSGNCTAQLSDVQYATPDPDGGITAWTTQSSVSGLNGRNAGGAVAVNGYLYLVSGYMSGADSSSVISCPIANNGDIGACTAMGAFPSARNSFGISYYNGYIYVVGGSASGTLQNNVYYAAVQSGGTLGSWTLSGTTFTTTRKANQAIAYAGTLYVIGGHDGTNALKDVQYISLATNGSLSGSWSYTTSLDQAAVHKPAVAANGYLYFFGNETIGTAVAFAAINSNGSLGPLYTSNNGMANTHYAGTAVYNNGYFYGLGGCSASTGANCTTVGTTGGYLGERTGQQATPRLAHYAKLFSTQVDTAPSQIIVNGYTSGPGSSVQLYFQTSSQNDPALGQPQIYNPVVFGAYNTALALNTAGTNVGVANNYFLFFTLDDTQQSTFPESNVSGNPTAITDITLYYHPNPSRRLRHGASFSDTACTTGPIADGCQLDTAP